MQKRKYNDDSVMYDVLVQSIIDAHAAISNMPPYGVTRRITVLPVNAW